MLSNVCKRTASVVAQSEVHCLKIRRCTFLSRLPKDQLQVRCVVTRGGVLGLLASG